MKKNLYIINGQLIMAYSLQEALFQIREVETA